MTGVHYAAPDLLEALARVEAEAGDRTRATELVGAADALRETTRVPLWGPLADRHARFLADLEAALGTAAFDECRRSGRSRPLDHWIALGSESSEARTRD